MSLQREVRIATEAMRKEDNGDLIVDLSFASELPYERWWGIEVLDCKEASVRLERLNDGAPILFNHNWDDLRGVHVPGSVKCDADNVLRGQARLTAATAAGRDAIALVETGVLTKTSVGYRVHKVIEQTTAKSGEKIERTLDGAIFEKILERTQSTASGDVLAFRRALDERFGDFNRSANDDPVYRVVDWEPFEDSLVTVPADNSVGVGRNADANFDQPKPTLPLEKKMPDDINVVEVEKRGADTALKTVNEILEIGKQYKCQDLAAQAIQDGLDVKQFTQLVLKEMANKPVNSADIGLTEKEAKQFSLIRAINALSNPGDRRAQDSAKFERECSDAYAQKLGRAAQGFFLPHEVQRRDLVVGTATAGGNTVATNLLAGSFIDMLRNRIMVMKMGAQMLTGLTGQVAIPRQTGGATAYWVAESGAPTESQQAFDQVTMTPKTLGAFTDISRKLLLQSSIDVEMFVQSDLTKVIALEIDRAAINGSGSGNEPRGVLNTSGIGDVAGGTNGLAPTWANVVELWSDLAVANADFGALGVLTNAKVIGKLMSTLKAAGVAGFIVENFPDADGFTNMQGLRTGVSNQVPSNLTKGTSSGVCSALISGNWNDLIIGQWGTLDLTVDPYTASTSGTVRVVALQDVDIAVRQAASFSAMKDALTV